MSLHVITHEKNNSSNVQLGVVVDILMLDTHSCLSTKTVTCKIKNDINTQQEERMNLLTTIDIY